MSNPRSTREYGDPLADRFDEVAIVCSPFGASKVRHADDADVLASSDGQAHLAAADAWFKAMGPSNADD